MTARLRHRAQVLKTIFPDCYREVDGYWVWGPQHMIGVWTASDLRVVSELLDEANRKWDAELVAYFHDLEKREEGTDNARCNGQHRGLEGPNEDLG